MLAKTLLAVCALVTTTPAAIIMQVVPAVSPNSGSPSFPAWRSNAINALQNGLNPIGDPAADPSAYFRVSQVTGSDNIVSSFPSWRGTADPGTAFGPAFANENGNIVFFGLIITGTASETFSGSNLRAHIHSDDPGTFFDFTFDYSSFNYGPGFVGIDPTTGNPITSGSGTQVVKALYYGGAGIVLVAPGLNCQGSTQATLDCIKAKYDQIAPFHLIADFQLLDGAQNVLGTGSGSVLFSSAPEPSSISLIAFGIIGIAGYRRRRSTS